MLCWAVFNCDEETNETEVKRQILCKRFQRDFHNCEKFVMVSEEIRELFAQCLDYEHTKRPEFDLIYSKLKDEQKRCEELKASGDESDSDEDDDDEEEDEENEEGEDEEEDEEDHKRKSNYRST
jgi:hypothetical protein